MKEKFDDYIYIILSIFEIYKGWYKGIDNTHITFLLDKASPISYSDSLIETVELIYRFDIWSKNESEFSIYNNEVLNILIENNFNWIETKNDIETDLKLYHSCIFVKIGIDDNDYIYI